MRRRRALLGGANREKSKQKEEVMARVFHNETFSIRGDTRTLDANAEECVSHVQGKHGLPDVAKLLAIGCTATSRTPYPLREDECCKGVKRIMEMHR
jgi:hypothetical protein